MVPLRGNIALAREYLSNKQHHSIRLQDTRICKVMNTGSKYECTILHVHTYALYVIVLVTAAIIRVATQLVKCELVMHIGSVQL